MAELLGLCALLGDCAQCCGMCAACGQCCKECCDERGREKWTIECFGCVCGVMLVLAAGACLGVFLYYSSMAEGDLGTINCSDLCGQGYQTLDANTCCLTSTVTNCQSKQICKDSLIQWSKQWMIASIVMGAIAFAGLAVWIIKACLCKRIAEEEAIQASWEETEEKEEKKRSLVEEHSINKFNIRVEERKNLIESCRICLREFDKGQKRLRLQCKHSFHSKCMQKHLQNNYKCPICQALIKLIP